MELSPQDQKREYTLGLVVEVGFSTSKLAIIPIDYNVKLTWRFYNEHVKQVIAQNPLVDQIMYQNIIGKLLYINMTRVDISYSAQSLC